MLTTTATLWLLERQSSTDWEKMERLAGHNNPRWDPSFLSARCLGWSAGSRMWPRCVPSFPLPARVNGARAGPDAKLDTARRSEETSTSADLRRSPANSLPSSTDRAWAARPRSSAASLSTATGSTPTRSTTAARRCDPRTDLLTRGVPIRERHPRPFYPDRRET